MIEDIKNIRSGRRELCQFGVVMAAALALWAGIVFFRSGHFSGLVIGFSLTFLLFGLTLPACLLPLQKIWMSFSIIVGWFMSGLIMIVLFFAVLTPMSIVARLAGKHFLDLDFGKTEKESYWIARPDQAFEPHRYENQF